MIAKETLDDGSESCPEVPEGGEPPAATMSVDLSGPFESIEVQLSSEASAKGCVTGNFDPKYTITGEQTYCTRSGYDQKTISTPNTWQASEFQSPNVSAAEDIPLLFSTGGEGSENLSFKFTDPVTLSEDALQMTMFLDLNRVLRFNNGAFQPDASNEDDKACRPFGSSDNDTCGPAFYPLRSNDFLYVFVGKPGKVEGYAWITRALDETAASSDEVPSTFECEGENNCIDIAGWMTTFYRPDADKPFFVIFNPDDDNALTVIKGGNQNYVKNDMGSFEPSIDPDSIKDNGNGTLNLTYSLGEQLTGTIKNFTPQTAVQTSFSGGAHFEVTGNSGENAGKIQYGEVFFKRGL